MTPKAIAIELVLHNEGGHKPGGDPNDPGGDTYFGISRTSFPSLPWPPSIDDASRIYGRMWDVLSCDALPPGVAIVYLDMAVNHGGVTERFEVHGGTAKIPAAPRMLQRAIRFFVPIAEDGRVGPQTLAAAKRVDPGALLERLCVIRTLRYAAIDTFPIYGETWSTRLLYSFRVALGSW